MIAKKTIIFSMLIIGNILSENNNDSLIILSILKLNGLDSIEVKNVARFNSTNNATRLNLSDLNIDTLPDEIGNLNSLYFLDLSNNNINNLPIHIKNCNLTSCIGHTPHTSLECPYIGIKLCGNKLCEENLSNILVTWLDNIHTVYIWRECQKCYNTTIKLKRVSKLEIKKTNPSIPEYYTVSGQKIIINTKSKQNIYRRSLMLLIKDGKLEVITQKNSSLH